MLKSAVSSLRSLPGRWKEMAPSVRKKRILIFLLIILHILPLWVFKYFPSQDGPAHVYNAYVLKAFNDTEESAFMREYYKLNLRLFPNWFSHVFMLLLMYIVPPLVAEKILLSIIVIAFPLSLFYFLDAIHKGKNLYGFLGFLFSSHFVLFMGFYNSALSVPLYFLTLGYFMKHKEEMSLNNVAILNLLCILTYFCHLLSFALLILSLTILSITSFYRKPRRIIGLLLCMLPLYFIMVSYLLSSEVGQSGGYLDIRWERFHSAEAWSYFLNNQVLVYFTASHRIVTRLMLVMLGAVFAATLYGRIRRREIMSGDNQFLLMFVIVAFLYFAMPGGIGSGGAVNDRLSLFIFPVLLPFLSEDYHKYIKRGMIILMVILSVVRVSIACRYYYPLDKSTKEYMSGANLIQKNKIVVGISSDPSPGVKEKPSFTHPGYVEPFVHVVDFYCLNNGCVSLSNYEPQFEYFPLDWTEKRPEIIHYVVAWKLSETGTEISGNSYGLDVQELIKSLSTDYDLIHSTENLKLYRHQTERSDKAE